MKMFIFFFLFLVFWYLLLVLVIVLVVGCVGLFDQCLVQEVLECGDFVIVQSNYQVLVVMGYVDVQVGFVDMQVVSGDSVQQVKVEKFYCEVVQILLWVCVCFGKWLVVKFGVSDVEYCEVECLFSQVFEQGEDSVLVLFIVFYL